MNRFSISRAVPVILSFLTAEEAVLALKERGRETQEEEKHWKVRNPSACRIELPEPPSVCSLWVPNLTHPLLGLINYRAKLTFSPATTHLSGAQIFLLMRKFRYHGVYPGIDLVYFREPTTVRIRLCGRTWC